MDNPENALRKSGTYFNKRINRRESLRLILGASISMSTFLLACGKPDNATVLPICEGAVGFIGAEDAVDCTKLPSVNINPSTVTFLESTAKPIIGLLPPEQQNIKTYVHTVDDLPVELTGGLQFRKGVTSVHLFTKNGSEIPNDEYLNVANYHETVHAFDRLSKKAAYTSQTLVADVFEANNIFPIFTEGTYLSKVGGHPQDGFRELYASGLTVMRFFPDQFLQKVEAIEDVKVRKKVANVGLDFINTLTTRSSKNIALEELPYSAKLIEQLRLMAA